jgi:protein-L-isoaspartate(D-aspartate) O-methyltransferase
LEPFQLGSGNISSNSSLNYQAIHVGAAAKKSPQKLLDQLAPGGKLLIPVYSLSNPGTQALEQIEKTEDGQIFRTKLLGVRFVLLTDKEVQWNED